MRTFFRIFLGLAAALPVLSSCQGLFSDRQGSIRISFLQDSGPLSTRAEDIPHADDFILTVSGSDGGIVYEGRFGDSPEEISVKPGSYTVSAVSVEFDAPAYDAPMFGDTRIVVVQAGETAGVQLNCRQLNCGIRLLVDDSFAGLFPDAELLLDGPGGSLRQGYDETRTAFFMPGTISVSVKESGMEQPLFTRTLREQQILSVNISASVGEGSGGISLQIDTSRIRFTENYLYGNDDASEIENAMSVMQARERSGEKDVWVCGYIVGVATATGRISFEPPFGKDTNIALGLRSGTADKDYCITVELKSGAIRDGLNLMSNPDLLGRRVYMKGDLVSSYYGIPGLKNVSEYQF